MSNTNGLMDAAKQFYNLTVGDPQVRISTDSAERRDAITKAGEELRVHLLRGSADASPQTLTHEALAAKGWTLQDCKVCGTSAAAMVAPAPVAATAPGALNDAKRQLRNALGLSQDFDDMTPEAMMLKAVERLAALQPQPVAEPAAPQAKEQGNG